MSWQGPNLAQRPFENLRPVRRVVGLLALAALALTAWNVAVWLRTGSSSAAAAAELERLLAATADAAARVQTLEQNLALADLEDANRQAEFLNEHIARRAFSWNALFDDLAAAMPRSVRLRQLTPSTAAAPRSGSARPRPSLPSTVALRISAEAEDDEALLEFIDRLFAHPRFAEPDLAKETQRADGLLQFDLGVTYHPEAAAPPPAPGAPPPVPDAQPPAAPAPEATP